MSRFTKRHSVHGQEVYDTTDSEFVAKGGFVAGGEKSIGRQGGNIVLPGNPGTVAYFDDFLGDLIADEWNYAESDTGHDAAAVRAQTNGVVRLHLSSTAPKTPAARAVLNHGLFPQWKADQGDLRMSARLKINDLTGANVFIGFADTGAAIMPLYDTGGNSGNGVPLAQASNAVGFLYSGGAASPSTAWRGVAVNADTVATSPVSGDAPTANTYDALELIFGDTGSGNDGDIVYFRQGGALKGSIKNPVLSTRAMVPVLAAFASEDTGNVIDLDYVNPSARRDTGE